MQQLLPGWGQSACSIDSSCPCRQKNASKEAEELWAPGPVPGHVHLDSVASFAPDVYRPVQAERSDEFVEHGVLVGFRFLVV